MNRGLAKDGLGLFEESIKDFDEVIKLDPNYINAFIYKGESLNSLGRSKEALEEYKKALEVDPNNQDAVKRKEELEITK